VTDRLRVVIADDHPPTRAAVREALERQSCQVVADVGTADAAVMAALQHRPDVCLLDINMPGSGIAAAADITHALPDVPVVMLTVSQDDEDIFAALRAGAAGYLLKDTSPDLLGPALRAVLAGEAVLPRWLVRRMAEEFRARPQRVLPVPGRPRPARLTEREAEVLDLMADGLSTEQIAERLHLAPVTVRTHVSAVVRKLRVRDRSSAVRVALDERDRRR
jgi:two-component system, NarL family, nitrate/nitrite response regulator NarL